jgi:hypothetical protein
MTNESIIRKTKQEWKLLLSIGGLLVSGGGMSYGINIMCLGLDVAQVVKPFGRQFALANFYHSRLCTNFFSTSSLAGPAILYLMTPLRSRMNVRGTPTTS